MNHPIPLMLTFEEKYQALLAKDPAYEGVFITGVKSTGIFCRTTCTARKPKAENVVFFDTTQEALQHGFRPCKVCKPLEDRDATPAYIEGILQELQTDPFLRIKDQDLRDRGISPSRIRTWFNKHHNMTFHAYQRMLRINHAYQAMEAGSSVTEAAFDHGFDSLSGFQDRFQAIFQTSPGQRQGKGVIHLHRFTTPLGPMYAAATDQGLCLLEFTDRRMLETEFQDLSRRLTSVFLPGETPIIRQTMEQMAEYFAGKRQTFDLPLHTPGTDFQQAVWQELQQIPIGSTRSYSAQAERMGRPKAVRAVARANGMNRIAIVIPCHRVIGVDGSLTGYAGGLARKQWLLEFEQKVAIQG
ncbi:MAG: methylated-DNA--[protein]-cysteine S-methyltransferase [Bacteroidota bacterium]